MNVNVSAVHIKIKTLNPVGGKKILSSSFLGAGQIKHALRQAAQSTMMSETVRGDKWVINLGAIPASRFDTLFRFRLVQVFGNHLARECASVYMQSAASRPVAEAALVINKLNGDDDNLYQVATGCLQSPLQLRGHSAKQLQRWLRLLLVNSGQNQELLPVSCYSRVTASRLSIAAMLYLLGSPQGIDWMGNHYPTSQQLTDWAEAIAQGEIPLRQLLQLFRRDDVIYQEPASQPAHPMIVMARWILPLWQHKTVRNVVRRQKGESGVQQIDACLSRCIPRQEGMNAFLLPASLEQNNPGGKGLRRTSPYMMQRQGEELCLQSGVTLASHGISNAGLLLLWPLLPSLFTHLGLSAEQQFISDTARWQAVYCLDQLVWGEGGPTEQKLTLNQLLCGVSRLMPAPPIEPLNVLQRQHIDDWLTATSQQLSGWQNLSLADIRQLFLQRPGEICTEGAFPQLIVKPEPYDFLLKDWPWPMTLASFPWTGQPLTIVWPLNGLAG